MHLRQILSADLLPNKNLCNNIECFSLFLRFTRKFSERKVERTSNSERGLNDPDVAGLRNLQLAALSARGQQCARRLVSAPKIPPAEEESINKRRESLPAATLLFRSFHGQEWGPQRGGALHADSSSSTSRPPCIFDG